METRVIKIDPRELKLLEINARFMRHEVYMRLVTNLRRDKVLTQLPFACLEEDGRYLVLSGNHRVKAAIDAGLEQIEVQVTDDRLSPDQRRAIQLSHNEVVGEDDPALLQAIYQEIDDIDWRIYTGLDDKVLGLLDQVNIESLSEANLQFQPVSMVFLPDELEAVTEVWKRASEAVKGSKAVWLMRWAQYDQFMDALEVAGRSHGVLNTATAVMIVLQIFQEHIEELTEGWLDAQGEARPGRGHIPLVTLLGSDLIPAKAGATVRKALNKMVGGGEIEANSKWQALERWALNHLEAEC